MHMHYFFFFFFFFGWSVDACTSSSSFFFLVGQWMTLDCDPETMILSCGDDPFLDMSYLNVYNM